MARPTKRRRLSAEVDDQSLQRDTKSEEGALSTSSSGSESHEFVEELAFDTSTASRIRIKQNGVSNTYPTDAGATHFLPASIQATLDSSATFATLGLDPWLVTSLSHLSIKTPTRIQSACIPSVLSGHDCIGGSRTGSGKTVAFAAPILQQWARDPSGIFAVILTPTRELALQIYEQILAIGAPQGIRAALVTGGADMRLQALELARRPHVVVATPGRLADHVETSGEETIRGLRRCGFVVLDEADRLLATGKGSMLGDVEKCLSALPPAAKRQTCLFTATVTPEVRALKDAPRDQNSTKPPPFLCEVDLDDLAIPATLTQTYQLVNVVHKEKYLHVLLSTPANISKSVIVFCNRTDTANLLEYMLRLLEHRITSLHSGLRHDQRISNLARFRARAARILIATDIAARGLDIQDVGLVINYDLPRNPDDYIHRVGRTARAGRKGISVSLVGQRDVVLVHAIEARVGRAMEVYDEGEKVSVEGRVIREALNVVGDKKREAMLAIEEGRDVTGKRVRRSIK